MRGDGVFGSRDARKRDDFLVRHLARPFTRCYASRDVLLFRFACADVETLDNIQRR